MSSSLPLLLCAIALFATAGAQAPMPAPAPAPAPAPEPTSTSTTTTTTTTTATTTTSAVDATNATTAAAEPGSDIGAATPMPTPSTSTLASQTSARRWHDVALATVRKLAADPTVHARDLFHTSVAMWEAWRVFGGPGESILAPGASRPRSRAPAHSGPHSLAHFRFRFCDFILARQRSSAPSRLRTCRRVWRASTRRWRTPWRASSSGATRTSPALTRLRCVERALSWRAATRCPVSLVG